MRISRDDWKKCFLSVSWTDSFTTHLNDLVLWVLLPYFVPIYMKLLFSISNIINNVVLLSLLSLSPVLMTAMFCDLDWPSVCLPRFFVKTSLWLLVYWSFPLPGINPQPYSLPILPSTKLGTACASFDARPGRPPSAERGKDSPRRAPCLAWRGPSSGAFPRARRRLRGRQSGTGSSRSAGSSKRDPTRRHSPSHAKALAHPL